MSDFNWTTFTTRIPVNAPVEKLYWCWATREGIEFWFLRMSEYKTPSGDLRKDNEPVQTGDSYRWRWYGWPDEVTEEGVILDCNAKDFFKFSFGKAGNVTVTLKEEQGENIVELLQDEIPTDDKSIEYYHLGCMKGWLFYLVNLKSILEGGLDLRNRKVELTNVVNS